MLLKYEKSISTLQLFSCVLMLAKLASSTGLLYLCNANLNPKGLGRDLSNRLELNSTYHHHE